MKPVKRGKKYQITYRYPGLPKPINEYFNSEEEALFRIAQINLEKKMGTFLPPASAIDPDRDRDLARKTMTVAQLLDLYVKDYGLNHWSESYLSCNQHRINDYILPYIGDLPIHTLTTHRLEKFYRQLLAEPAVKMKGREDEERTIAPSVIERVHTILRSALNQAIRWDYLRGANPAMTVELPRYKKDRREAWDEAEVRHAMEVCNDEILTLCMYLAIACSLRIGEILALTWDCIHIEDELLQSERACIDITKELRRCNKESLEKLKAQGRDQVFFTFPNWKQTETTTVLVLKTPKTESSVRTVFIAETVASLLKKTKARQEALIARIGDEYQNYNLVVAQDNGRPCEGKMIDKMFKALIAKYNLRPVVFHSLRHSSTTFKLKISGGDIKSVQGDTGHSVADMVTNVYSHIMNEDRRNLAQKMETDFFGVKEPSTPQAPMDNSTKKLMQLLQASPDLADTLLQMTKILGGGQGAV